MVDVIVQYISILSISLLLLLLFYALYLTCVHEPWINVATLSLFAQKVLENTFEIYFFLDKGAGAWRWLLTAM
jgi:hypothetical protein